MDEIIRELRQYRDEYAARFNYDVKAMLRDLRERTALSGRKTVKRSPRRLPLPQHSSNTDKELTLAKLRDACAAQPFRPFSLHLNDGRKIAVIARDHILVSPNGRTIVVWEAGDRMSILDPALVTKLEINPRGKRRRTAPKVDVRYEIIIYWNAEDQAFIAEVPELAGCAADGATYQGALAAVEVVIQEWIETARELGRPIPEPRGRLLFA